MGSDAHCSLCGRMFRVRSCTERSGVWIEMFFPADSGERSSKFLPKDDDEPDQIMFIPHDVRYAITQDMKETELDVDPEDDEYAPMEEPAQ